jgi:hypothetical protein
MAKKSQVPPAPEMTALPMSGGDSPLVIDLPDGQKLVVGNLTAGSVIEVATWRGTGRPDSRTSRLMLGMSSAQDKPADAKQGEEKKSAPSFIAKVLALVGKTGSALASAKTTRGEKKSQAPLIEKVTPPARTSEVEEVDDWLNSILEKSAKKSAVKPVTTPAAKPAVKKAAVKKAAPKKTTTGRKR